MLKHGVAVEGMGQLLLLNCFPRILYHLLDWLTLASLILSSVSILGHLSIDKAISVYITSRFLWFVMKRWILLLMMLLLIVAWWWRTLKMMRRILKEISFENRLLAWVILLLRIYFNVFILNKYGEIITLSGKRLILL